MRFNASTTLQKKLKMAGACVYLFSLVLGKKYDISKPIKDSDAENTKRQRKYAVSRLHRRSLRLRLPTRRKWAQSGYLCTTPSTAHAEADAGISWS